MTDEMQQVAAQEAPDDGLAAVRVEEQGPPQPAIRRGWLRALLGVIAFVIALVGVAIAVGVGVALSMMVGGEIDQEALARLGDASSMSLGQLALAQVLNLGVVVLVVWLLRRFVDRRSLISLGLQLVGFGRPLVEGLLWGAALIASGYWVLRAAGALVPIEQQRITVLPLLGYLLVLMMVAVNEELFVRGYLLNNLMDSMNRYAALLVTALTFAVLHLFNANISLLGFFNLVLAGVVLGIYYVHRRNLWFSIAMHLTWNFFQGPVFGFEVSGVQTPSLLAHESSGSELLTGGSFGLEGSVLTTVLLVVMIVVIHLRFRQPTGSAAVG